MSPRSFVPGTLSFLACTLLACAPALPPAPDETAALSTSPDALEISEPRDDTAAGTDEKTRREFIIQSQAELEEISQRREVLEDRIRQRFSVIGEDLEGNWEDLLADLNLRRRDLEIRLELLENAGSDRWEDLKEEFQAAYRQMSRAIEDAEAKSEQPADPNAPAK